MKKVFISLILVLCLFSLTGCNDTIAKEGSVTMTLPGEWVENITLKSAAPSRTFSFDGSFNVYETSSVMGYVFTKNDNYKLSDALEKHLQEVVKEDYIIVKCDVQTYDNKGALFGDKKLSVDEGFESKEYSIVSWAEDGTRYSYLYRSFVHDGKTYYAYTYNTGITMSMEVPLICQVVDGKQQIFMLALPYDTQYQLNVNTKVKSLFTKNEYLEEEYHSFEYPHYLSSTEDKENGIKDWYIKYCNGRMENDVFVFTYLGIDYTVTFTTNHFIIYVK